MTHTKSIIQQEIEDILVFVDGINSNNADLRIKIYSAIQNTFDELKKERILIASLDPLVNGINVVKWSDVEKCFEVKDA